MHSRNIWKGLLLVVLLSLLRPVISEEKDIVFLVDTTAGATSSELDLVIDFIYKVASFLTIGPSDMLISVVTFSSAATESFDLDDYPDSAGLLTALTNLKTITPSGNDGLVAGLNYVKDNSFQASKGARTLADDTLVLIAHSQSVSIFDTAVVGSALGLNEVHAYTVGIGSSVSQSEMMFVSTDPDPDNNHVVNSFGVLCDVVPILVPKLDSTSSVTSADGCDVTTTSASTTTTTTTSTTTTQPTTTTTTAPAGPASLKDIIFVVDVSSGANDSDLNYITDFVYKVVATLTIGDNDTLVSIVTFSDTIEEHFSLDVHKSSSTLLSATSTLMDLTPSGDPQTFEAFNYISASAFDNGRSEAPDIVVLVTYSESTSTAQTAFNALSLRTAGASIFVVAVGDSLTVDNDELVAVASSPNSYYLHYVANFSDVCELLPTFVPKLDSSKTASTDVCSVLITSSVTASSVNTDAPSENEEENTMFVVGVIAGGVCVAILLLIGVVMLLLYCKNRDFIVKKTKIKEISQSHSSIRRRKQETGHIPISDNMTKSPKNPNRPDSNLSSSSHGSVSSVALITERDLPGMITKEQPPQIGDSQDKEMTSSLVSILDPTNESEKTFDEGYKSNSMENRTPGSAGSDQLSFSNSEKDMFHQDFSDWRNTSPSVHSQFEPQPTEENFENPTSKIIDNDNDNAFEMEIKLTTDSKNEKNLGSETAHSIVPSQHVSKNEKSDTFQDTKTTTTTQNRETATPKTRSKPLTTSLADAIHASPQNTTPARTTQLQKPKMKKHVLIRQETQQSIYSRRPSMVHIDIGDI